MDFNAVVWQSCVNQMSHNLVEMFKQTTAREALGLVESSKFLMTTETVRLCSSHVEIVDAPAGPTAGPPIIQTQQSSADIGTHLLGVRTTVSFSIGFPSTDPASNEVSHNALNFSVAFEVIFRFDFPRDPSTDFARHVSAKVRAVLQSWPYVRHHLQTMTGAAEIGSVVFPPLAYERAAGLAGFQLEEPPTVQPADASASQIQ